MDDPNNRGFSIKDRRTFASDDTTATADETDRTGSGADEERFVSAATADTEAQEAAGSASRPESNETLPSVDFSAFLLSLATSAMYHLGAMPDPDANTAVKNLPLAKQTIDIIGMLREKTTGNLDPREDRMLADLLFDLRMRYVDAMRGPTVS